MRLGGAYLVAHYSVGSSVGYSIGVTAPLTTPVTASVTASVTAAARLDDLREIDAAGLLETLAWADHGACSEYHSNPRNPRNEDIIVWCEADAPNAPFRTFVEGST